MNELNQLFRCNVCGNIVQVTHNSGGILTCDSQPMELLKENTVDASVEKHVPMIEIDGMVVRIKIGMVEHPMTEEHYIEWIEFVTATETYKKFLHPGEKPEAEFTVTDTNGTAREYCNLHGLWKK